MHVYIPLNILIISLRLKVFFNQPSLYQKGVKPWEQNQPSPKQKNIPTDRTYYQTQGRVTANEHFFKSSII